MSVRFGLLGPLEVVDDAGVSIDVGGRQPRLVLTLLLLAPGRPVSVDALLDALWGDDPPASAVGTLQSYVSRLRKRLEATSPDVRLTFDGSCYRLDLPPDSVDIHRFETLAGEGRALLDAGEPERARSVLEGAEALWRGPALIELADHDGAVAAAARLQERRLAVVEDRIAADLALGRHAAVVGELTGLVADHPLREGLRVKLALALYRSGRQADALRAIADAGRTLRDELGIEPGRELRELESAILCHDPALDALVPSPTVDGRRDVASPQSAPLIGREAELAILVGALDEAAGDARFVVLEGEPGIGKTRLADELRGIAAARGCLTVWGRSDEGGAAPALWPWLPLLRAVAQRVETVPPSLRDLLVGEAPLVAGQGGAVQFERFEAVAELLDHLGGAAPVVFLFDDLQWADTTSLELLEFLSGRLEAGVVVVVTMRQLEVGRADAVTETLAAIARRPGSRRLHLRGLSATATVEVLASAARPLPADMAAAIHARAEGNPFYAIELARLVDEEGEVAVGVPANVGDVIRRRLTRLPTATVDLLGIAAVVGRDVDLQLLAGTAGVDLGDCVDGIDAAVEHRLLVEVADRPGVLRFSHALVREVLLDGLTSLRRARLHLRVADAMEALGGGAEDAEILADHLWRAASVGVGRRAAAALERAAEVALHRVSYTTAETLLSRAVQLRRATASSDDDLRDELTACLRLLEVMQATRYFQGTDQAVLDRAKELAGHFGLDDLARRLFLYEWSALGTSCRQVPSARAALVYEQSTAGHADPRVRSSAHYVRGSVDWSAGRVADAVEHYDAAIALLDDAPPPEDAFEAEQFFVARMFEIMCHALHGDRSEEETFGRFDAIIEGLPTTAIPGACGFAGCTAAFLHRWELVEHYASTALEIGPASQFAFWGGQLLMYRGMVEARAGHVEAALSSFDEGRARYTGGGARSGLSGFEAGMGVVLAEHGHVAEGAALVGDARTELETYGEAWNAPIVLMAEGVLAHARGDETAAASLLAGAAAVAVEQGSFALARRADGVAAELGLAPHARSASA